MIDENSLALAEAIACKQWARGLRKKYTLDEVKSDAYLGLVKASKTYNEDQGKFTSYAYRNIYWTIGREAELDKEKYNAITGQDRENLSLEYEYTGEGVTLLDFFTIECKEIQTIEDSEQLKPLYNLPRALLEPLVAYYFEGFTQQEIGDMMGLSVNAVNNRIMRAKEKLRNEIVK